MIAIGQGSVRIIAQTPTSRDVILAEIGPGEVFGEIALLDGGERSADAVALTNGKLLVLDRRDVLTVLQDEQAALMNIIAVLCQRIRNSDTRMMEFAFMSLAARLARAILRLAEAAKSQASPIKLSISQSELADMVGGSRENVNRCLRKWHDEGRVELRDGWLVLLDMAWLQHAAESELLDLQSSQLTGLGSTAD